MKFDVYCDESRPDLLGSTHAKAQYMVIGSLWLASSHRGQHKQAIHDLRDKHKIGGEFKWVKATASKRSFYSDLIKWFMDEGEGIRFRCIVVDRSKVNLVKFHNSDQELGFYKFYYQMLHHWILDYNEYSILCDYKSNRLRDRLRVLGTCLQNTCLSSRILTVQAVRSRESVLLQMTDFLTGIVGARFNGSVSSTSAKASLIADLESALGHPIGHTPRDEQKFNVFVINLDGGW